MSYIDVEPIGVLTVWFPRTELLLHTKKCLRRLVFWERRST
jgi:hypothetical protein